MARHQRPGTTCPGCGADLPSVGQPWNKRLNGSPECWLVYGEVIGFEMNHAARLGRYRQLSVDAYGAQHPGDGRGLRVPYSLVGLHLALDRGASGLEVRRFHQRMGRPDAAWPRWIPPEDRGIVTAVDVANAGPRANSIEGHEEAVQRWARSVWKAWEHHHHDVAPLADRLAGLRN